MLFLLLLFLDRWIPVWQSQWPNRPSSIMDIEDKNCNKGRRARGEKVEEEK
jgi:hypothetical protein